jgi:hypothetical protein
MKHWKHTALEEGKVLRTSEKGNSMTPLIKSGQEHELTPCTWQNCNPPDIVFCKVRGHYYTHKVLAKDDKKGLQIGNNRGGVNGWTKQVFGKVTQIF